MAQARNDGFELAFAGVAAHRIDQMRTHEAATRPGTKAAEIGAALDRVQVVMADFKAQQRQVGTDAGKPDQAGGAIRRQHDAVIHVAPVLRHFERALAIVVKAVQIQVGKGLAHQVADGHAGYLWALREGVHQVQSGLAFDDACHPRLQDIAVD